MPPYSELPSVDIQFENGNLGISEPNQSKLMGIIVGGNNVGTDFVNNEPVLIKSLQQVIGMGLNDSNNPQAYSAIKEFYDAAPLGTPVYVMMIPQEWPYDYYFKPLSPTGETFPALDLVKKTNHKIRGIFCQLSFGPSYSPERENGIDPAVTDCIPEAKSFIDNYLFEFKTPIFVMLEASHFNGMHTALDITNAGGVGVFFGQTEWMADRNTKMQSIGFIAGRVASIDPHVNIGRKRDKKMVDKAFYFGSPIDNSIAASIHADSCITFRSFPAENGFFFSDDPMLDEPFSDYRQLTSVRVINEAYRIAYKELSNEILNDVPVTNTGTVSPIYAKTLEGRVKSAIFTQLGASLSIDEQDKDDMGVECEIDLEQNLIATSTLKLKKLRVRPKGYNRYIQAPLGFTSFNLNNN
jgi:hypothetical protein